jgi:hypothetical protein
VRQLPEGDTLAPVSAALEAITAAFALGAWAGNKWNASETYATRQALAQARTAWAQERTKIAEEREAQARAHAAALGEAAAQRDRWRAQAREAEETHEKQLEKARLAAADSADAVRRLREQLSAAGSAGLSAAARAALEAAARDVAGDCAAQYRRMGDELAQCGAELMRVHGMWPTATSRR